MKAITDVKEVQHIALDILVYFDTFCNKHQIKYMLAYGTLLGAVRHKGFIPWDDDLDIMMTRSEYCKLLKVASMNNHPYYSFRLPELDNDYYAPLAKMIDCRTVLNQGYGYSNVKDLGLYIDIFVIDNIPSSYAEACSFYERAQRLRLLWAMSIRDLNAKSSSLFNYFKRLPVSLFCKVFGFRYWRDLYIKHCSQYHNTEKSGIVQYGEGIKKEYMDSKMFESLSTVEFENLTFYAPSDVHKYLTQMYGDYMCLPPENQRKYHPNEAYWKE